MRSAMQRKSLQFEFVDYIPEAPTDGVLYISAKYATAVHRCCCGCGVEVATPLSPSDWQLLFDGVSVSLSPSIGNWSLPCRSHYWIERNRVVWAKRWSQKKIDSARIKDAKDLSERLSQDDAETKKQRKRWFANP